MIDSTVMPYTVYFKLILYRFKPDTFNYGTTLVTPR